MARTLACITLAVGMLLLSTSSAGAQQEEQTHLALDVFGGIVGGEGATDDPADESKGSFRGCISGEWQGTLNGIPLTATMTQYLGGVVDGTWQMPTIGAVGEIGPTGEPGKILGNGQFELRFKVRVGSYTDFYYRGSINADGTALTGTLQGSGFTGNSMVSTSVDGRSTE